jgi:hypothetical protein
MCVTNLKQHQGLKPQHLLELRAAYNPVTSYNHKGKNGGCNLDAATIGEGGGGLSSLNFHKKLATPHK